MAFFRASIGGGGGGGRFSDTTLYDQGLAVGYAVTTSKSTSAATAEDAGTYLRAQITNSTYKYAWVGILADLTDVDFIYFYGSDITHGQYSNVMYAYASPSMPNSTSAPSGGQNNSTFNTTGPTVLDVRSMSGMNYVGIGVTSGQSGGARKIDCNCISLVKREY